MLASQYSSRGSIPGSYYGSGATAATTSRTTTPDTAPSSSGHSNNHSIDGSPTVFRPAGCSPYCSGGGASLHPGSYHYSDHHNANVNANGLGGSGGGSGDYGSERRRSARDTHRYSMPNSNRSPLLQHRSPSIVRLNECKHFHYESVELGPVTVLLLPDDDSGEANFCGETLTNFRPPANANTDGGSGAEGEGGGGGEKDAQAMRWTLSVESNEQKWLIRRTFHELAEFDRQLHRCVFERRHSRLRELATVVTEFSGTITTSGSTASTSGFVSGGGGATSFRLADDFPNHLALLREEIVGYVDRLSQLTGSLIKCYPVLKFLELDSRGNHFLPIEHSKINTPAIAVAIVVSDFIARDSHQLSLRVGDIVSVIEMDAESSDSGAAESFWRGKLTVPSAAAAATSTSVEKRKKGARKLTRSSSKIVHSSLRGDARYADAHKRASEGGVRSPLADENAPPSPRFQVGYFPRECVRLFTDKLDFDKPRIAAAATTTTTTTTTTSYPASSATNASTKSAVVGGAAQRNRLRRRELTPPPPPIATGSVRSYLGVKSKFGRWQSERRPLIKSLLNVFLDSTASSPANAFAGAGAAGADHGDSPVGRVFGVDLEAHLLYSGREVPLVLTSCISVIENHGIVTGIYRQCGIQSNIRRLRWEFDNGMQPNLLERGILCDIHCVASLLKQYFRQLPNPLFTYELYDQLVAAYDFGGGGNGASALAAPDDAAPGAPGGGANASSGATKNAAVGASRTASRIVALQAVVRRLPRSHFRTAMCLMKHLSRVSKHKEITDMTASNLAIVWAPNLIRCPPQNGATNDAHLLMGLDLHKAMCNFMISHASAVFGPTSGGEGATDDATSAKGSNSNFNSLLTVPGWPPAGGSTGGGDSPDTLESDAKRSRRCVDVNVGAGGDDFGDFHTVLMPRRGSTASRKRSTTASTRKESAMSASTRSNTAKLEGDGSRREHDPFSSWRRFFSTSAASAAAVNALTTDGTPPSPTISGGSGFWGGGGGSGGGGGVGRWRKPKRRPQLSLESVANRSRSVESRNGGERGAESTAGSIAAAAGGSDNASSTNGSVRWRHSALANLGRNVRDTVIRRMRTVAQRRHGSASVVVVAQSLDETMPLATLRAPVRTLKFQPLDADGGGGEKQRIHSSQFALPIVNSATVLRNRLEKHSSVSPSLMRRPTPASGMANASSPAVHATSLSLHRPQQQQRRSSQQQSQQQQQQQLLSNAAKRSSLLFASKFAYVDESAELDGQPERRDANNNNLNNNNNNNNNGYGSGREETKHDTPKDRVVASGCYSNSANDTVMVDGRRHEDSMTIPAYVKNSSPYRYSSAAGYGHYASGGSPNLSRTAATNGASESDKNDGNYYSPASHQDSPLGAAAHTQKFTTHPLRNGGAAAIPYDSTPPTTTPALVAAAAVGSPLESAQAITARRPMTTTAAATSVDMSSSESLPLDVSRYDNVAPQAANIAAMRMQARLRNSSKARFNRPTSTPLISGEDAPPLPTRGFMPSPSAVRPSDAHGSPLAAARNANRHAMAAAATTVGAAAASDGSSRNNLYYF